MLNFLHRYHTLIVIFTLLPVLALRIARYRRRYKRPIPFVICECGVIIIGEFVTDGDGNPICPLCLSEFAKEPKP